MCKNYRKDATIQQSDHEEVMMQTIMKHVDGTVINSPVIMLLSCVLYSCVNCGSLWVVSVWSGTILSSGDEDL